MLARKFWKEKFGEYPKTDADKLAIVMMTEYGKLNAGNEVDSETSRPNLANDLVECSFVKVLKQFGFKLSGKRCGNIKIYTTRNNQRYAEIIRYNGWAEVWVVGKNIPCNSTMSYPGGSTFSEPVKLLECLNNCV